MNSWLSIGFSGSWNDSCVTRMRKKSSWLMPSVCRFRFEVARRRDAADQVDCHRVLLSSGSSVRVRRNRRGRLDRHAVDHQFGQFQAAGLALRAQPLAQRGAVARRRARRRAAPRSGACPAGRPGSSGPASRAMRTAAARGGLGAARARARSGRRRAPADARTAACLRASMPVRRRASCAGATVAAARAPARSAARLRHRPRGAAPHRSAAGADAARRRRGAAAHRRRRRHRPRRRAPATRSAS